MTPAEILAAPPITPLPGQLRMPTPTLTVTCAANCGTRIAAPPETCTPGRLRRWLKAQGWHSGKTAATCPACQTIAPNVSPRPAPTRPRADHHATAAHCRRHPGVWVQAHVYGPGRSAAAIARQIRTAVLPAYAPAGSFDAETRPHPDGWAVWARHLKETP